MAEKSFKRLKIEDGILFILFYSIVSISAIITLYPFVYVFSMSVSDPLRMSEVVLFPKGFSLGAFKAVINETGIWRAYFNTIYYTLLGSSLTIIVTMMAAFTLTRKGFVFRKMCVVILLIPMFIGGGIVPSFILINKLHLFNTLWAIILPGLVSSYNVIMAYTFMKTTIPESLIEAARMDGMNDMGILFKIVVPLSAAIIAVIGLWAVVGYWNSYFNVLLYIRDRDKQTLQIYLMRVLIKNANDLSVANERLGVGYKNVITSVQLKYALIMFTIAPVILVYPFLQRYFIKGIMIGSLKE